MLVARPAGLFMSPLGVTMVLVSTALLLPGLPSGPFEPSSPTLAWLFRITVPSAIGLATFTRKVRVAAGAPAATVPATARLQLVPAGAP